MLYLLVMNLLLICYCFNLSLAKYNKKISNTITSMLVFNVFVFVTIYIVKHIILMKYTKFRLTKQINTNNKIILIHVTIGTKLIYIGAKLATLRDQLYVIYRVEAFI